LPRFAFSGTKYCADPAKAGTGRRALAEMLPSVHCYTLEVSFFCSANGNIRGEAYTPASYTDMGQSMALALHEYYSGLETPTDASWHKDLQAPGQEPASSQTHKHHDSRLKESRQTPLGRGVTQPTNSALVNDSVVMGDGRRKSASGRREAGGRRESSASGGKRESKGNGYNDADL